MAYLPELNTISTPSEQRVLEFRGYSQAPVISDGEMRVMHNLSSDMYPNLTQRAPRGRFTLGGYPQEYGGVDAEPETMLTRKGKLAVVAGADFYYGTELVEDQLIPKKVEGIVLTPGVSHKLVAINTRIVIYPEKIWYNTETGAYGNLDEEITHTITSANPITITNDTTTNSKFIITNYAGGLPAFTASEDVVDIEVICGQTYSLSAIPQAISLAGGVLEFTFPADTFLQFLGGQSSMTIDSGIASIRRTSPDLEFVMESNNRLWGCAGNTIYASKLGDPLNWNYYQALSVDSYAVEVGTDGAWTGCCAYANHLLFFKENYIHKVYGNQPSNFQIQTAQCYSLETGSDKSVCVINETVFYKSRLGIMAYTGNLPELISSNFGTKKYRHAVAGTDGIKYYVSLESGSMDNPEYDLFVFDLDKVMWHREDTLRPRCFSFYQNDELMENPNQLLYISDEKDTAGQIFSMSPEIPLPEEDDMVWAAELGDFDEYIENKKIYSKLKMRLNLPAGSEITVMIRFDNLAWQTVARIYATERRAVFIPINPIRCDKFRIRLEGVGRCVVESLVREVRERSER